ncbi:MAG TPA: hypothetical protein VFQ44_12685 [Streptosporangiaceae bacterium]|nr:hypothetical protein [Streptosporangiaceae bacterium]
MNTRDSLAVSPGIADRDKERHAQPASPRFREQPGRRGFPPLAVAGLILIGITSTLW